MFARCLMASVALAAFVATAPAADPTLADGKYVVGLSGSPSIVSRLAIVELKTTDGKTDVKTVSGGAAKWEVSNWKVKDGVLTADMKGARQTLTFEGKLDANGGRVVGSVGDDTGRVMGRGVIAKTDLDELDAKNSTEQVTLTGAYKDYMDLRSAPTPFAIQANQEKDADKRKELMDKYRAGLAKFTAEGPALLRKAVDESTDDAVLYFVVPELLRSSAASKAKPDELKAWAEKGLKAAAGHGPRAEKNAVISLANTLAPVKGAGAIALPLAEKAVAYAEKGPGGPKVLAMKSLALAQADAGKADAAKATWVAVEKLDAELDVEYKKEGPGFTPTMYASRTDKEANRVAVMELFTGAMCPPCVAADLAFDGLESTYSPKDVVLLQYHMHIPGPDPLTNPNTVARWDYYGKLFPQDMRGVPSSVFDGKPQAGGGGGKPNAKSKYDQYRKIIDATLEKKADVTISGGAKLDGGEVKVDAAIAGKAENATVRIVLAEEEVRYLGGNGIRLHHQVVRSMFGKGEGWKVKDLKDGKATASVKLDDLKKSLSEYMEKYHAETAKFSNPDRPLKFEHLKVIVLVQDDETGEILNAAQFDVAGKK